MTPVAMTIAGSDPSGGAGLQADLKTFHQHGVYGTSVVTLLTVQNTRRVSAVDGLSPDFVMAQLDAVVDDIPPRAAKTGALGSAATIEAIAARASTFLFPLVVDPVMVSKHGASLIDEDAVQALKTKLLSKAYLLTPNLSEASILAEMEVVDLISMEKAAEVLSRCGAENVLIKGGQIAGDPVDLLWSAGQAHRLEAERVETKHTHGAGCVLSAAITARLARGDTLLTAVKGAKQFVAEAIQSNPGIGHGHGPLNLHATVAT